MNIAIFVDSFPSRSETFVINQVMALIDAGAIVSIISVYHGDHTLFEQSHIKPYKLTERVHYLLDEHPQDSLIQKVIKRFKQAVTAPSKCKLIKESTNLRLPIQLLKLFAFADSLKKVQIQFDWVVCHFGHNGVLANQLRQVGLINGKIATVFHGADISAVDLNDPIGKMYSAMLAQTELALPISELWAQRVKSLGGLDSQVVVQRMGVELNRFRYAFVPHGKASLKVFTAARFSEKKGLIDAIDAVAIASKHVDILYEIGGFGELETQIKARIAFHNLESRITLLGPLTSEDVSGCLREAHVYLLPSITASNGDREGVPVAIMEAMACGVPVVSTLHSGIPELVEHNTSGLLAPERSPESLANYLIKLATDDKLREVLAINARKKIELMGDVDKLNQQLLQTLADRVN